jgi:hypothetical protein
MSLRTDKILTLVFSCSGKEKMNNNRLTEQQCFRYGMFRRVVGYLLNEILPFCLGLLKHQHLTQSFQLPIKWGAEGLESKNYLF